MALNRLVGVKNVVINLTSSGQIQFIKPVYDELRRRRVRASYYVTCDSPFTEEEMALFGLPMCRSLPSSLACELRHMDLFLESEIWGRGPTSAIRVFFGHGQPNKHTHWSDENLKSFDKYFLYGELERSMFALIQESQPESTRHIELYDIGYPKLDAQIQGAYDRQAILAELGLDPSRPTVLYAPAWDPGGSLRTCGIKVVEHLLSIPKINVIVKLHPISVVSRESKEFEFFTGGIDWAEEFGKISSEHRFRYVSEYLINPLLSASDLMVTDFSGVALEFMMLDRPVIYIDCPEFYEKTLVKWGHDPQLSLVDDRFNAGRNAGLVVNEIDELPDAVTRCLENPDEFGEARRAIAKRFLYNPGRGSESAADAITALLGLDQGVGIAAPGMN
jgi:hypothetical protein